MDTSTDQKTKVLEEVCIEHALKTFMRRRFEDTHPVIVMAVLRGEFIDHWYYKSDQWIEQPTEFLALNFPAYVGSANLSPVEFYGPGTYFVDDKITRFVHQVPNDVIRSFMKLSWTFCE